MNRKRTLVAAAVVALAIHAAAINLVVASPAAGVTPTLLARGTYPEFKVSSLPGRQRACSRPRPNRTSTSSSGATTTPRAARPAGTAIPYPVLITVIEGTLTFYSYDDPTCSPTVVSKGGGYVDNGRGHIARNESGVAAVDVSVIMAPVGAAFRSELDAPNDYCGF